MAVNRVWDNNLSRLAKIRVIADTSFLMLPGIFGVDVLSELDRLLERRYILIIPQPVVGELKALAERGKPSERSAARLALALVKRGEAFKKEGEADEVIMRMASERGWVVGTADSTLRKRLRRKGIPVIYLRQRSHLAINGWLG